ncbi:MAG: hypothetical protein EHM45_21955 [Desulfobacteraceae bacterium]|nr:MAG: hypothetical protein EHM45_21955 [Desulfobacteraceae bacterium]
MNLFAAPYRGLKEGYEKRYTQAKKLFIVDLILLGIIGFLIGLDIYLVMSRPGDTFFGRMFGPETKNEIVAGEQEATSEVAASDVLVKIKINGQEEIHLTPGESLEYAVSFKNNGEKSVYDVALKINLEGALLDFGKIAVGNGAARDRSVVWTKDQVPQFAELLPGANGELKFKIETAKIADPALALKFGGILKSWPEVSYKKQSNFGTSVHWTGKARENKFNSDLAVRAVARYYTSEGDQLGRGPLPPAVGKETKYWVFLSLENNLNDLSNVSVSALLPPNVFWTENVSVSLGELTYNPSRRAVTWKIGEVGRYTGEDWPTEGAAFELALTPNFEQQGKEATLLEQIKAFGDDKFTSQFIERFLPNLTTNLVYDSLAKDKSKVVAR